MPHTEPLCEGEFSELMTPFEVSGAKPKIAVAVSGGADSMALVLLAQKWARVQGVHITALTVDHGLRDGSDVEAVQVKSWLSSLRIDHQILTWLAPKTVTSAIQARARDARYRLMGDWCRAHDVCHLLLAHHLDDQAETVLMRMKKQSTLYGLGGMAAVRDLEGVSLCRPFLSVPKSRLTATLQAKGQDWVEDPSNQNMAFERVRVRAQLIDLAEHGVTAERLAGAARSVRAVCNIIDEAADCLIKNTVSNLKNGRLVLAPAFLQAPDQVSRRALSKLLRRVGGGAYPASPDKLERLQKWMKKPTVKARTLAGVLVRSHSTGFEIAPELPRKKCKNALE